MPIFLLRIDFLGKECRFSTKPCTFDGKQYIGTLDEFDYTEESSILGSSVESNSISAAVHFDGIDLVQEWRAGRTLEGCKATFSYILDQQGQISSREVVLLVGTVQMPVFGDPREANTFAAFTVESKPFDLDMPIIPAEQTITQRTFTHHDEQTAAGKMYPIILGAPGNTRSDTGEVLQLYSTPAYNIKRYGLGSPSADVYFLIAGHECIASDVYISDGVNTPLNRTVLKGTDINGNVYSYIDVTGAAFLYPNNPSAATDAESVSEYWVYWPDAGLRNPYGEGALTGAGDICRWALSKTGLDIDHGSWSNISAILNTYTFDGYINAAVGAWQWLNDNILPLLPIEIRSGPNGLYPVLAQIYAINRVQPRRKILAGSNFKRISAITTQTDTSEIYNAVSIHIAKNGISDAYNGIVRIASNAANADSDRSSVESAQSANRYGISEMILESDYVYNRESADRMAYMLIQSKSFPQLELRYRADIEYAYLQLGDVIELTDEDLYFENVICTIVSKNLNSMQCTLGIQIQNKPQYRI